MAEANQNNQRNAADHAVEINHNGKNAKTAKQHFLFADPVKQNAGHRPGNQGCGRKNTHDKADNGIRPAETFDIKRQGRKNHLKAQKDKQIHKTDGNKITRPYRFASRRHRFSPKGSKLTRNRRGKSLQTNGIDGRPHILRRINPVRIDRK